MYGCCHLLLITSKTKLPECPLFLKWPFSVKCLKSGCVPYLEICLVAALLYRQKSSRSELPPEWLLITISHLLILQWPFHLGSSFPCLHAASLETSPVPVLCARWRVAVTAGGWCIVRMLPKAQQQSSHSQCAEIKAELGTLSNSSKSDLVLSQIFCRLLNDSLNCVRYQLSLPYCREICVPITSRALELKAASSSAAMLLICQNGKSCSPNSLISASVKEMSPINSRVHLIALKKIKCCLMTHKA